MANALTIQKEQKKIDFIALENIPFDNEEKLKDFFSAQKITCLCLPISDDRATMLEDVEKWFDKGLWQVIKQGQFALLLQDLVLNAFKHKFEAEERKNLVYDQDIIKLADLARQENIQIKNIDQHMSVYFNALWHTSKISEKLDLITWIAEVIFANPKHLEKNFHLKNQHKRVLFDEVVNYFSQKSKIIKLILLEHRNKFLANAIKNIESEHLTIVIPTSKIDEVKNLLEQQEQITLETLAVAKPSLFIKYIPYFFILLIISFFVFGFFTSKSIGWSMLGGWAFTSGLFTFISALIVLAHPVTLLSVWIVAPLAALTPVLGAGTILAIIEAFFRKPRVCDLENLALDLRSFKGIFHNRIIRICLVFFSTAIGSSIGVIAGFGWLTKIFK